MITSVLKFMGVDAPPCHAGSKMLESQLQQGKSLFALDTGDFFARRIMVDEGWWLGLSDG